MASATQLPTWKDRAIAKSEGITDAWEVVKIYGARCADWILFGCMIANIIEILPGVAFWQWAASSILGIQAITLDIAGFGLASMAAEYAATLGDTKEVKAARTTGWCLIAIMMVTLVNVCVGLLFPNDQVKMSTDYIDKGLILVRVLMMVIYGHVVHDLRSNHAVQQHGQQDLQQENETLTAAVTTLQQQLESHQHRATTLQKELGAAQQEMSRLEQDLANEQRRSSTLQDERDAGQGDSTTLRKQLNAVLIEVDTLRAQLDGKGREVESLKEALTGSETLQQSRVQQLLATEQKQVERLRQQLEDEQGATLTLRQQLHTTNLQVFDLAAKLEEANQQLAKLQFAESLVRETSTKLEQKDREFAAVQTDLLTAKCMITNLQNAVDETANLPGILTAKEEELAGVLVDLQTAKLQIRELQNAKNQTAKSSAKVDNVTSIETAKNRISHAEVLAYMTTNPSLKRAEVAANLGISERKVYDAVAWGKEQETMVADA